jgi:hypothetical protein
MADGRNPLTPYYLDLKKPYLGFSLSSYVASEAGSVVLLQIIIFSVGRDVKTKTTSS